MDLIKTATEWALGDALQGKLMMASGVLALTGIFFILKSDAPLLKGMLIPLALFALIGLSYGGYLAFTRAGHLQKVETLYASDANQAVAQELEKAERDNYNYTLIKKIWPVLIVITAVLLFFFKGDYAKGVLIALLILFVYGLLVDTLLHHRLTPYYELLQTLSSKGNQL